MEYRIKSNDALKNYNVSAWIEHIVSLYNEFYMLGDVNFEFEIEFSENVSLRKKEFFLNKDQCGNSKLDGAMVFPEPPTGMYYILLDERFLLKEWKYDLIESFTHELTHLYDYLQFAHDNCDGLYLNIPKHDYWLAFYFWSEYHAKWIGYRCMFTQLLSENDKEQIYDIANRTLIRNSNDALLN